MAKVNVSLPDELLEEVGEVASGLGRSRSGFVREATAHYIAHVREEQAAEERRRDIGSAMASARRIAERVPIGEDTTELIRRDRDDDYGSADASE